MRDKFLCWMEERCFNFYILHYKVNAGFTYKVLKSPQITHVMCTELVAKVLEFGWQDHRFEW